MALDELAGSDRSRPAARSPAARGRPRLGSRGRRTPRDPTPHRRTRTAGSDADQPTRTTAPTARAWSPSWSSGSPSPTAAAPWRATRELLRAGLADAELREAVGAAVRHVGELWQAGQWTITQEHAATAVAEAVLTSLEADDAAARPPVGTVAVVAAEGEWHAFPARLASHAFEAAGLAVRYLGAGVPADDVARTLPVRRGGRAGGQHHR